MLSYVAYPAVKYFSTLSEKRQDFWGRKMLWKRKGVF
jgi:hypothetical protein